MRSPRGFHNNAMNLLYRFIPVSLAFLLLTAPGCSKTEDKKEILVGEFGALSGKYSQYGISTEKGIQLAVDEVNRSGGVLERKIRLVVADDQGEPEKAQTVVSKLIAKDRVVAVIGEAASSRTRAAAPVCQQNRIPLISPAASDPRLTQIGPYIFRACFTDDYQGHILAKFVLENLKLSRVAILRDIRNSYSTQIADRFAADFKNMGGVIVADQKYNEGDQDFTAELVTIRSLQPRAILIPGYVKDVGKIIVKARDLGITAPLIGADAWENPELLSIAGEAVKRSFYSSQYSNAEPGERNKKFVDAFEYKFHSKPDALAALGYDAMGLLVDAIRRGQSAEPSKIQAALTKTQSYPGLTGFITFDKDRNPIKPGVIFRHDNGKFEYFATVLP